MFTRKELMGELPRLSAAEAPLLEVVEFGHFEFDSPSSEQSIFAFRGSKQDFATGLLFWVKTLQAQEWQGRESYFIPYAEAGLCMPILKAEFAGIVADYSRSLRKPLPPFVLCLDGYQLGLKMYSDWDELPWWRDWPRRSSLTTGTPPLS